MDAVSSKPKKSMRVATIFTGIATCAAGMAYGGTAQAATHTTVTHTPKLTQRAVRPAGRNVSGSIQEVSECGNNTWLHVFSIVNEGRFMCFGYKGTTSASNETGAAAECGGNNYGWMDSVAGYRFFDFGTGTTFHTLSWPHLSYVHISGWTGNDVCRVY
jgi:hypothetical protein